MTGDIEVQASMDYKVSTFINLKTNQKRETEREKNRESKAYLCGQWPQNS